MHNGASTSTIYRSFKSFKSVRITWPDDSCCSTVKKNQGFSRVLFVHGWRALPCTTMCTMSPWELPLRVDSPMLPLTPTWILVNTNVMLRRPKNIVNFCQDIVHVVQCKLRAILVAKRPSSSRASPFLPVPVCLMQPSALDAEIDLVGHWAGRRGLPFENQYRRKDRDSEIHSWHARWQYAPCGHSSAWLNRREKGGKFRHWNWESLFWPFWPLPL